MRFARSTGTVLLLLLLAPVGASVRAGASDRDFDALLLRNEQDPAVGLAARARAAALGLPRTIHLRDGVLIHAIGVEDGRPLYAVVRNLARPSDGGSVATYEEVAAAFDLRNALIDPPGAVPADPAWRPVGRRTINGLARGFLLVPDWTADKVMAFDPANGDLLDTAYIHSNPTALASPKEARLSPRGTITVSDQITDQVQDFDSAGSYLGRFAPAGGVNTAILDNIRGHAYRPNGRLVVAVGSGGNQNAVAEFDSAGNYLGTFIAAGSGGLNSPFGIIFRASDVLVTTSSTPTGILRFDLNGGFLSLLASISSFPQQIIRLPEGTLAVANFSGTGNTGIRLHADDGTFLRLLAGVTGNRGVYRLQNGNYLTTNSAGIHVVDSASGGLVRTVAVGTNMQYINHIERTLVGVAEESASPDGFSLAQNYPNPFNPSTTIELRLPAADPGTTVSIAVFDLLGREVRTLYDAPAGEPVLRVTWDGRNNGGVRMPTGVYICRVVAGTFTAARKMTLLQ